ncbi:hypothetical protein [Streptomyces sp. NPDC058741]|uniref:hypothetical protein n=1 Tax=unclassified Streptomyces TaxID=2593676 RepID=UPI003681F624
MSVLRPLVVFFAGVLVLAVLVLGLACGVLVAAHGGLSADVLKGLALLALCLVLLVACNRFLTGQWHRWSKLRGTQG